MNKIYIVGIGAGDPDYILPIAKRKIDSARVLIGGRRSLETFAKSDQKTFAITGNLDAVLEFIRQEIDRNEIVVMVSGDPGFYSLLPLLRKHFENLETIPGISSMQLAFARLNLPWHDARLISFHGRTPKDLEPGKMLGILTDSEYNSKTISKILIDRGWNSGTRIAILSRLSYPDELIIETNLQTAANSEPISHGILIVGY
ncbi:MAG: precorrin-6y C5,15-methyltransferase (decarboxylating) subunit CbiE [Selenomonadaceae bacterium]|nr:precorrin-6y C5,15-methyltransferase (decarboxylating) subunit CbiE [Selenomonadaceae bacterium]